MARSRTSNAMPPLARAASAAVVVAGLYWAQDLLAPMALAVLLAFVLSPTVKRIDACGVGRIPAVLCVVVLAFVGVAGTGWMVSRQLVSLANELPAYQENLKQRARYIRRQQDQSLAKAAVTIKEISKELSASQPADSQPAQASAPATLLPPAAAANGSSDGLDGTAGQAVAAPTPGEPIPVQIVTPSIDLPKILRAVIQSIAGSLGTAAIVVVLVIFMLIYQEQLRDRAARLLGDGQVEVTAQALEDIGQRISRYLIAQCIINGTYAVCVGVSLWLIGLPNALLWALLAGILRFIPYVGAWISAGLPVLVSLAVFDDWLRPLLTVGLFVVLELLVNNVMEPCLYSSSTGLFTVAVLVAALFWAWLWGPLGLVLATPMTVCVAEVGKRIPQLGFLEVLLGSPPQRDSPSRCR